MPIYTITAKENHYHGKIKAGATFTIASSSFPEPSAADIAEALFINGYTDKSTLDGSSPGGWECVQTSKGGQKEYEQQRKQFQQAYEAACITENLPYVRKPQTASTAEKTDKKSKEKNTGKTKKATSRVGNFFNAIWSLALGGYGLYDAYCLYSGKGSNVLGEGGDPTVLMYFMGALGTCLVIFGLIKLRKAFKG